MPGRAPGSDGQTDLFSEVRSPLARRRELSVACGKNVSLRITRNRRTMASVAEECGGVKVSVHRAFLNAPERVWNALGAWIRSRRPEDWAPVRQYALSIRSDASRGAVPALRAAGTARDLRLLADEVNREHFRGRLRYRVGWGRNGQSTGRRRSIRFGSCDTERSVIRIHPALDSESVPVEFLKYILYHEMLHLVVPPEVQSGRCLRHPPAFRALERRYPGYDRMAKIGKDLLCRRAAVGVSPVIS
jgi:hypothetical protein